MAHLRHYFSKHGSSAELFLEAWLIYGTISRVFIVTTHTHKVFTYLQYTLIILKTMYNRLRSSRLACNTILLLTVSQETNNHSPCSWEVSLSLSLSLSLSSPCNFSSSCYSVIAFADPADPA